MPTAETTILAEYNGSSEYGERCEHRLVERDGKAYLVIVRHDGDGPKRSVCIVPEVSIKRVLKYLDSPTTPAVDGFAWTGMHWLKEHTPPTEPLPRQEDYSWANEL